MADTETNSALAQADKAADRYAIVTSRWAGMVRADVAEYPIIFALGNTDAEATAQARECLKQHLAAQLQSGRGLVPPKK